MVQDNREMNGVLNGEHYGELTLIDEVGDDHQVDVMIDNQNILIESNSLKALRIIRNRFIENGFILLRDEDTEKMFKQDKITRYLRVFRIVRHVDPLCWN